MNLELSLDSIETAHHFVALLCDAVVESRRDIEADVKRETEDKFARRREALQIVLTKLETLDHLLTHSRRTLNDLRSLRRVMFEERAPEAFKVAPPAKTRVAEPAPKPPPPPLPAAGKPKPVFTVNKRRALSARVEAKPTGSKEVELMPWYYRPGARGNIALKRAG